MKVTFIGLLFVVLALTSVSAAQINSRMNGGRNAVEWKEYFDSFLEGVGADDLVEHSTDCVHNLEQGWEDMSEAINHIYVRGWTWENWLDLQGALGDVTPIVRTCYNVTEESVDGIKKHYGSFGSFVNFIKKATENAGKHVFDWYDVYAKINEAVTRGRPKEIAYQIGRSVRLLLDFPVTAPVQQTTQEVSLPDLRPLEDFMKGFLNGTKLLDSDNIKKCINETEFMVQSIEDAQAQFNKKTPEGFKNGIMELADMFAHLKPLNEECVGSYADIKSIIAKYIKTFSSPLDIALNAAKHFKEIYSDVLSGIQDFNSARYKDAGRDMGDIFYNIFFTN
jgi:hypothetical protein